MYNGVYNEKTQNIESIKDLLLKNTTLTCLDLEDNGIQSEGLEMIANSLKTNDTLKHLNLSHNIITSRGNIITDEKNYDEYSDTGKKALFNALKVNETLTELKLCECDIDNLDIVLIKKLLEINSSLNTLDLSKNRIFDFETTIRLILKEQHKDQVMISSTENEKFKEIHNFSIQLFKETLQKNNTLTDLNLNSSYGFSLNELLLFYKDVLKQNTTLIELNLSDAFNRTYRFYGGQNEISQNNELLQKIKEQLNINKELKNQKLIEENKIKENKLSGGNKLLLSSYYNKYYNKYYK